MAMSFKDDPWFVGFIDGEGCFTHTWGNKHRTLYPRFSLCLREDDAAILEALHAEFGGYLYKWTPKPSASKRRPTVQWKLQGKDLPEFIRYLERFPLRTKKAAQFAAWRQKFNI